MSPRILAKCTNCDKFISSLEDLKIHLQGIIHIACPAKGQSADEKLAVLEALSKEKKDSQKLAQIYVYMLDKDADVRKFATFFFEYAEHWITAGAVLHLVNAINKNPDTTHNAAWSLCKIAQQTHSMDERSAVNVIVKILKLSEEESEMRLDDSTRKVLVKTLYGLNEKRTLAKINQSPDIHHEVKGEIVEMLGRGKGVKIRKRDLKFTEGRPIVVEPLTEDEIEKEIPAKSRKKGRISKILNFFFKK